MKSGVLWNEVMTALHKREFSDVKLEHQLADALGMQLVRWPKQFDVIVADNLFGDMLSDVAAMLTGSLGMLPSASLGDVDPKSGRRKALYEPVHGSAPDIAGKGIANPIAMIGSFGMALRYSFGLHGAADRLDAAIAGVLAAGFRTADIRRRRRSQRCRRAKWATQSSRSWRNRPPRASPTRRTSQRPALWRTSSLRLRNRSRSERPKRWTRSPTAGPQRCACICPPSSITNDLFGKENRLSVVELRRRDRWGTLERF